MLIQLDVCKQQFSNNKRFRCGISTTQLIHFMIDFQINFFYLFYVSIILLDGMAAFIRYNRCYARNIARSFSYDKGIAYMWHLTASLNRSTFSTFYKYAYLMHKEYERIV